MEYAAEDGFGLFIYAGKVPASAGFASLLPLDEEGYILVSKSGSTEQPGLYAAGDVCAGERMHTVEEIIAACAGIQVFCEEARLRTGLIPAPVERTGNRLFEDGVIMQLWNLFDRMDEALRIRVYRKEDPASAQLARYMEELADLTDKLQVENLPAEGGELPCAAVLREGEEISRFYFHGIPDAYAFTPFILLLYYAAGPGQGMPAETRKRAQALQDPLRLLVMVRPDDPGCGELITAAGRLAAVSEAVCCDIYDSRLFTLPETDPAENVLILSAATDPPVRTVEDLLDRIGQT